MKNKIQVVRYTNPHYHAGCNQCDFAAGRSTDETPLPEDVRKAVRSHVLKTGHTCWIESGDYAVYSPISAGLPDTPRFFNQTNRNKLD